MKNSKQRLQNSKIPKGQGTARVVITNVSPLVDNGNYPAKAIAGQELILAADLFCDGHDEIAACVYIRHESARLWQEWPLKPTGNDRWELPFCPEQTGRYQFRFAGWVDHFRTWKKDLGKKIAAGQELKEELSVGALLLEQYAGLIPDTDKKQKVLQWVDLLNDAANMPGAVSAVSGDEITLALQDLKDKSSLTVYPLVLSFEAGRKKAACSTWYELFPRSASREPGEHGSFADVEELLPRIAAMGFDVLYLPPIHPIGVQHRKGKNNALIAKAEDPGSPWAIGNSEGGHKSIHPQLGTLKDFRRLVRMAEQQGIEIALDLAFQCSPDHPYVQEHPQWFRWRPDGTVQYAENPPKKYEDILPFNFETPYWESLWEELKSIVLYWIKQGIRIFRVDNPHTKPFAFWEWLIATVRSEYPDVLFLAEAFTRPRLMEQLAKSGFTQSYTYFTWRNTKSELETYIRELTTTDLRFYFRPNFWPNTPDILPPYLSQGGENAHIIRLVLAATLSASYGIYGPVYEFGINTPYAGKEEYTDNEKYELKHWDWDSYTRLKDIITRVNRIRKEHTALQSNLGIDFAVTTNEQIIAYTRKDRASGDMLLIVVNLDPFNPQTATVHIPGIDAAHPCRLYDLLSGDHYLWQQEANYVSLDPWQMPAHIFKIEPTKL